MPRTRQDCCIDRHCSTQWGLYNESISIRVLLSRLTGSELGQYAGQNAATQASQHIVALTLQQRNEAIDENPMPSPDKAIG